MAPSEDERRRRAGPDEVEREGGGLAESPLERLDLDRPDVGWVDLREKPPEPLAPSPAALGVWELAWPTIVSFGAMTLVRFADFAMVGSLGPDALAAVGLGGQVYWLGRLRVHSGNIYAVALSYPGDFPYGQMKTFVVEPFITDPPHRYGDGQLCLYSNDHGGRGEGYSPGACTAATYVGWVSAWLHAYEVWSITGRWPERRRFQGGRS